ncbi:MAG: CPBP family intramembrane metalloprotease [Candidatus Heimdallarchaeota archaeon]|nr:CPBP family intramembrane metalloprotease [Candidatus Heimdallarchaeota archaeon]MCG3253936.1 CPBP family intramembrane metalloprotease [Candidatus Heimdallarchaeota archaeon]MCK4291069.1 CPBP family intramembrane metalloprotease [Candidatus Heimdallarchaeota archaeon]
MNIEIKNENNNNITIIESEKKSSDLFLILFFVITFVWSWVLFLPNVLNSYGIIALPTWSTQVFSGFAIFGPLVAALIVTGIAQGGKGIVALLKKGIKADFNKKWLLPIFLLFPILAGIAFGIIIPIFGYSIETGYYNWGLVIGVVLIGFFVGGPLGEEFGWRGYALDPLQKRFGGLGASLILGFIWGVWHLPLHFITGTTQQFIPIWAFILLQMVLSVFYTWIYNNTGGSVLAVILLHWTANIAGALIPYWQLGLINGQLPNNLWLPTYGMLIGFAISLILAIVIAIYYGPKKLVKEYNSNQITKSN